jgi:flagellar biosynthesis/type III secretory pathway chaperone
MPETSLQKIETLYLKTQKLLTELSDCVAFERDSLVKNDLENLMSNVKSKQKILITIEDALEKIRNIRETVYSEEALSARDRQRLAEFSKRIAELKREVRKKNKENISCIQEAMIFFNDLISMFIDRGGDDDFYGLIRKGPRGRFNLMFDKEV